jgi:hypothetical protein
VTGQLAAGNCPNPRAEVFLAGTQPVDVCRVHGGGSHRTEIASWDAPGGADPALEPAAPAPAAPQRAAGRKRAAPAKPKAEVARAEPEKAEKQTVWGKLVKAVGSIFK